MKQTANNLRQSYYYVKLELILDDESNTSLQRTRIYYIIEIWICIFLTCILLLGNFIKCSIETMSLHLLYSSFINNVIVESLRFFFS